MRAYVQFCLRSFRFSWTVILFYFLTKALDSCLRRSDTAVVVFYKNIRVYLRSSVDESIDNSLV